MKGPWSLLRKWVLPKPATVPAETLKDIENIARLSVKDKELLKNIGIVVQRLGQNIAELTQVNYDRGRLYQEVDRAALHWMVGAALELYADYSTTYNSALHNASVWITSESSKYEAELTKLLDRIGIEEKIYDWAWTVASYGDLFPRIEAKPGLGVVVIDDGEHPIDVSRIDYNGVLVGFYKTPMGTVGSYSEANIIPPWEYAHIRLLGAKRKRPMYGHPLYSEFRTVHLLAPDTRQVTTKYGTSLIMNALPVYKRLRLAEDSLLLARLTRGVIKYIYKLKVTGTNIEAVSELMDEYSTMIKRARALDLSNISPNYDSKANPLSAMEDIFIPVWGDARNDLVIDKIGEDANIRWIADILELRNQLAASLRVPLPLTGAFTEEATGALGASSMEKLDIRFARSARRLQRSLQQGLKRICQIHLAFMNMDPDPILFDINMSETSTAEEEQIRASLDAGVDVVDKFMEMLDTVNVDTDRVGIVNYLNRKILKLDDFDLNDYVKSPELAERKQQFITKTLEKFAKDILGKEGEDVGKFRLVRRSIDSFTEAVRRAGVVKKTGCRLVENLDLKAPVPLKCSHNGFLNESLWKERYGKVRVKAPQEEYSIVESTFSRKRKAGGGVQKLSDLIPDINDGIEIVSEPESKPISEELQNSETASQQADI